MQRQHVDQLRAPREPLPAAGLARAELQAGQHGARHQGAVAQPPQGGAAPQGKVQQDICRLSTRSLKLDFLTSAKRGAAAGSSTGSETNVNPNWQINLSLAENKSSS